MGEPSLIVGYFVVLFIIIFVVIGLMSLALGRIAKPKGDEIRVFTSSAPGETIVDFRICNACLPDARPNQFATLALNAMGADGIEGVFALIRKMTGGLWVGGRVILTSHRVIFAPNAMNRAVHESLSMIAIRLRDVTEVKDRFGVGSRIIDIATPEGSLAVRTPRAVAFRDAIRQARTRSVSQPANRGLA
jgi:hypothetical protein